jgi:predicted amidohydrolase YtcJ
LGLLTPGCYADLIVLEQDPFGLDPQDLHTVSPTATMLEGAWVYES